MNADDLFAGLTDEEIEGLKEWQINLPIYDIDAKSNIFKGYEAISSFHHAPKNATLEQRQNNWVFWYLITHNVDRPSKMIDLINDAYMNGIPDMKKVLGLKTQKEVAEYLLRIFATGTGRMRINFDYDFEDQFPDLSLSWDLKVPNTREAWISLWQKNPKLYPKMREIDDLLLKDGETFSDFNDIFAFNELPKESSAAHLPPELIQYLLDKASKRLLRQAVKEWKLYPTFFLPALETLLKHAHKQKETFENFALQDGYVNFMSILEELPVKLELVNWLLRDAPIRKDDQPYLNFLNAFDEYLQNQDLRTIKQFVTEKKFQDYTSQRLKKLRIK